MKKYKIIIPIVIAVVIITAVSIRIIRHNKVINAQNQINVLKAEIEQLEYQISWNEKTIKEEKSRNFWNPKFDSEHEAENIDYKNKIVEKKGEIIKCLEVIKENS